MNKLFFIPLFAMMFYACDRQMGNNSPVSDDDFPYFVEQFADIKIMRYQIPGFESLSPAQKELVYYLSEAALCGRDILFDQNGPFNLTIRRTLEAMLANQSGAGDSASYARLVEYTKRVWFSSGIHHHYSNDKFVPGFTETFFRQALEATPDSLLPLTPGQTAASLADYLVPIIFDPTVHPKRICQDTDMDIVTNSSVSFYRGVTEKEALDFYESKKVKGDTQPVSYGLNTTLVKEKGKITEEVWKLNGKYHGSIEKIIFWLGKARDVAETPVQKASIGKLVDYYTTGDLRTFDEYNILWLSDTAALVDFVNGFIETYGDPLGLKATWESVVNFKNLEATRRTEIISANAQWFEDHSPVDNRFKKPEVKGITAKVITVAQLGGDCYPSTPIGINLPNADWIRKEHGSKSVTMENITYAYDQVAQKSGFLEEFQADADEVAFLRKYGNLTGNLHTDLHECLGHGSGQLLPGVSADALKNYHAPLEETRADLFALYYMADAKMTTLGLLPDAEAYKAEYMNYIRNGLMTQLTRIEPGKDIQQAHMRNRQLISKWCFEQGAADKVIELFKKEGKTYVRINDFEKLRTLFGQLLGEVQRIKSEGDYEAGKALVEKYGVKVDQAIHQEVLARYKQLNIAPYGGFINPVLKPVLKEGKIVDVTVDYTEGYTEQMLRYSKEYSFLQ